MKGKGRIDAIFIVRQMQQKFRINSKEHHFAFTDIEQEGQHPLTALHAATCFQWGSVPLRSDIKGKELSLPIY